MRLYLYILCFSLFTLVSVFCQDNAEALLKYASTLRISGEVIKIDEKGVRIKGETMIGTSVRSPREAVRRAAELIMERAITSSDRKDLDEALSLWRNLSDTTGAIPYLRMRSKQGDSFARLCQARLAGLYELSGDTESAFDLFSKIGEIAVSDDLDAESVSEAALYFLSLENRDKAVLLAKRVVAWCDPNKFSGGAGLKTASEVLKRCGEDISVSKEDVPVRGSVLDRARVALSSKDYETAIQLFIEQKRLNPAERGSREGLLIAADLARKINQVDRAYALYLECAVQYSMYTEGCRAALAAIEIKSANGDLNEAIRFSREMLSKSKTAEMAAWISITLAELYMKSGNPDSAASLYLDVLQSYFGQDAAKGVLLRLKSVASDVSGWRVLVDRMQECLTEGRVSMSFAQRSYLRRFIMEIYIVNNGSQIARKWIRDSRSLEGEAEYIKKDLVWFYVEVAQSTLDNIGRYSRREVGDAVETAVDAWSVSPGSEEGFSGLRVAVMLSMSGTAPKSLNIKLEKAIKEACLARNLDGAKDLLRQYYKCIGLNRLVE